MQATSSRGTYVFAATDGGNGNELWIAGAGLSAPRLLKDIRPGLDGAAPGDFTPLADGRLLFAADDGLHGRELWVTDGTEAGTRLFRDVMPGAAGSALDIVGAAGSGTLLAVDAAGGGRELWITDGTPEGTRMLAGPAFGAAGTTLLDFNRMADGQWLFVAKEPDNSQDVWVTDGTAGGTRILADSPVRNGTPKRDIMLSPDGQDAYITDGSLIWRTDGTAEGTTYLGGGEAPLNGGKWLDTDWFEGSKYVNFILRDGTPEGDTRLFKPFGNWSVTSFGDERSLIYSAGGLTVTDSTAEGTRHYFGGVSYYPSLQLTDFMSLGDGRILFTEMLGGLGSWDSAEVWVTDGTAGGTYQIGARSADLPKSLPDSSGTKWPATARALR
ncbi:hypothetical protein CR162_13015 [Pseudoroseomonas rhizosphaerae]|uniref:Hyalin n=1 Tax=Teichococcus rhizosphaerae TaxID=1335062 RepID=A0A2C7AAI7_9PROT|nr:ELWxxDGT repeat protein [Pseudoroseomonas rhizosphaerae]PHK94415.1 hypothetical protein CR162_13015 [Pseudoroseomonas rhizosphaerae]